MSSVAVIHFLTAWAIAAQGVRGCEGFKICFAEEGFVALQNSRREPRRLY
jgi:hypothetical protein